MDEDAAVGLVEEFDGAGFGVEFNGAGHAGREFLLGKVDARNLRVESSGDEGAEEGGVGIVSVERGGGRWGIIGEEETAVGEGGEVLEAVGGDVGEGLGGEEVVVAPGFGGAVGGGGFEEGPFFVGAEVTDEITLVGGEG